MGERQHYIPETYIKCFLNSKGKVWKKNVRTKYPDRPREFHAGQMGYFKNFYRSSQEGLDSNLFGNPDFVEDVVNTKYENLLGKTFGKFVSDIHTLSYADRMDLSGLMLHIKRRSSYYRENVFSEKGLLEIKKPVITSALSNIPHDLLVDALDEGYTLDSLLAFSEQTVDALAGSVEFRKDLHISSLALKNKDHSVIKRACQNLASGFWEIWKPALGCEFISSDNPGFVIDRNGRSQNIGFSEKFKFYFPLTSDRLLAISAGSQPYNLAIGSKQVSQIQCIGINNLTAKFAQNFIFGKNKDPLIKVKVD